MKTGFKNINRRQRNPVWRLRPAPQPRRAAGCGSGCNCRRWNAEQAGAVKPARNKPVEQNHNQPSSPNGGAFVGPIPGRPSSSRAVARPSPELRERARRPNAPSKADFRLLK